MANILVVYGAKSYPLRATTEDHLYCFRRYSGHQCYYFNMLLLRKPWYRQMPYFLKQIPFDLIIFYVDLLNIQWPPYSIEKFISQAGFFKKMQAMKIALMQDEFYHTDTLDHFVREYEINYVYTLAPESEWRKIYPNVDMEKVKFMRVLPGYLDDQRIKEIERLGQVAKDRPVTIGYRAIREQNMQWLGRHGFKKIEIAELFQKMSHKYGIQADISTSAEDALLGNQWYEFLLRSKYTIAIEGGASVLDHDGTVRQKTEAYLAQNPKASFDEIEVACFPEREGELNYFSISPKHLEACLTKTCQVLVAGEYNNILLPDLHYMELKRDFSNIDQVMTAIKQDYLREQIVERAYKDIVESGLYTYRQFVKQILSHALGSQDVYRVRRSWDSQYLLSQMNETLQWLEVAILSSLRNLIRRLFPKSVELFLRKIIS